MSLDISLTAVRKTEVFERNITHNLTQMAQQSGLYIAMWHPEQMGAKYAKDLIPTLTTGLIELVLYPDIYMQFNPLNGWGDYDGLVRCVAEYLRACMANPDAEIETSV